MVQHSAAGSLRVSLNSSFFLSPKIEDPPRRSGGSRGLKEGSETASMDCPDHVLTHPECAE